MNRDEYVAFCRTIPGALVDQPFEEAFDVYVARHADTGKWFAAVMNHGGKDFVNLKCEPVEAEFLRSVYAGVSPAWHMNKTHWNTVLFESDVPDAFIRSMTMESFRLTDKKKGRRSK